MFGISSIGFEASHALTRSSSAYSDSGRYLDRDVVPGRRYRYVVVLEGPGGGTAPASRVVEIRVPEGTDIR